MGVLNRADYVCERIRYGPYKRFSVTDALSVNDEEKVMVQVGARLTHVIALARSRESMSEVARTNA